MNRVYVIIKDSNRWPDILEMLRAVSESAVRQAPHYMKIAKSLPYGAWYGTDYGYIEYNSDSVKDHLKAVITSTEGIAIDVERTL